MRTKICFITHDASLYGASQSLKTLLYSLSLDDNIDYDLIVSSRWKNTLDKKYLSEWFSTSIESIHFFVLPFFNKFKGSKTSLRLKLENVKWILERKRLYDFLKKGNYDWVYLNSTVLLPVVNNEFSFVMHVRESLEETTVLKYWKQKIESIKRIFFIDRATCEPFNILQLKGYLILNNPFDMTYLGQMDALSLKRKINSEEQTIFALIGSIHPDKGVDFIINSFINVSLSKSKLLIVGNGYKDYVNYCKRIAARNENIIFWGEESEIGKIFLIADFILRGESFPCIGRTTYEGLFSGCKVIVPGNKEYYTKLIEDDHLNDVLTYSPRNKSEFEHLLKRCDGYKIKERIFLSNVEKYKMQFLSHLSN